MTAISITVNGDPHRLAGQVSVAQLLADLDLDPRSVVVELNREIVRRPRLTDTYLKEGDQIELVHFVGGG